MGNFFQTTFAAFTKLNKVPVVERAWEVRRSNVDFFLMVGLSAMIFIANGMDYSTHLATKLKLVQVACIISIILGIIQVIITFGSYFAVFQLPMWRGTKLYKNAFGYHLNVIIGFRCIMFGIFFVVWLLENRKIDSLFGKTPPSRQDLETHQWFILNFTFLPSLTYVLYFLLRFGLAEIQTKLNHKIVRFSSGSILLPARDHEPWILYEKLVKHIKGVANAREQELSELHKLQEAQKENKIQIAINIFGDEDDNESRYGDDEALSDGDDRAPPLLATGPIRSKPLPASDIQPSSEATRPQPQESPQPEETQPEETQSKPPVIKPEAVQIEEKQTEVEPTVTAQPAPIQPQPIPVQPQPVPVEPQPIPVQPFGQVPIPVQPIAPIPVQPQPIPVQEQPIPVQQLPIPKVSVPRFDLFGNPFTGPLPNVPPIAPVNTDTVAEREQVNLVRNEPIPTEAPNQTPMHTVSTVEDKETTEALINVGKEEKKQESESPQILWEKPIELEEETGIMGMLLGQELAGNVIRKAEQVQSADVTNYLIKTGKNFVSNLAQKAREIDENTWKRIGNLQSDAVQAAVEYKEYDKELVNFARQFSWLRIPNPCEVCGGPQHNDPQDCPKYVAEGGGLHPWIMNSIKDMAPTPMIYPIGVKFDWDEDEDEEEADFETDVEKDDEDSEDEQELLQALEEDESAAEK